MSVQKSSFLNSTRISQPARQVLDSHLHRARRAGGNPASYGSTDGFVAWDLRTKYNLDIAPGLYIFHIDDNAAGRHAGRFAIIK